jgi:hypothetical protein
MKNPLPMLALGFLTISACSDDPASPRARLAATNDRPHLAAAATTTSDVFPITLDLFVPCANGGAGELVVVSGNLHQVLTSVDNGNGGLLLRSHFQPQGLSGVGQSTGTKYQATGVTESSFILSPPFPVISTFVNNFRFIGAGPGNNFLFHEVAHLTIDAGGNTTVEFDKATADCK